MSCFKLNGLYYQELCQLGPFHLFLDLIEQFQLFWSCQTQVFLTQKVNDNFTNLGGILIKG